MVIKIVVSRETIPSICASQNMLSTFTIYEYVYL